jgi:hypothetical protein
LVILPTGLAKCPFKIELRGQISFWSFVRPLASQIIDWSTDGPLEREIFQVL